MHLCCYEYIIISVLYFCFGMRCVFCLEAYWKLSCTRVNCSDLRIMSADEGDQYMNHDILRFLPLPPPPPVELKVRTLAHLHLHPNNWACIQCCWSGSCLSLWCGFGSCLSFDADVVPDPDPTFHCDLDTDPDPTFQCELDPDLDKDRSLQRKAQNLGKMLIYSIHFGLFISKLMWPDPNPAYHFDVDLDPDLTFSLMRIRINNTACIRTIAPLYQEGWL